MYLFFGIFLIICIVLTVFCARRRTCIIDKVRCMELCEKVYCLNDLLRPLGYSYCMGPDIITSTKDAWQRAFGYCALFDRSAPRFNIVLDCEPIYFDYDGRTWMIEFWKGQYGVNTGAEIGVYRAECILKPEQYDKTLFHSVPDSEMMGLSMQLFFKGRPLFCIRGTHWWLTGFCVGHFCEPRDLTMKVSLTFPNSYMLGQFLDSLTHTGYETCAVLVCGLTASFTFAAPCTRQCHRRLLRTFAQWKNRLFCRLYLCVTRPFDCTLDKLLYLYYFLPAACRRTLLLRRSRKQVYRRAKKKEPS